MTSPVDIRPDHLRIVRDVLRDHLPAGVEAWVFGSRAQWSAREGSDLDLALEGEAEIDREVIEALADAFEDSDLPYTVDVVDTNRITKRFRHIVESSRVPLPVASEWRPGHWGEFVTLEYGRALRGYRDSAGPFRVFGTNGPIGWHNEPLCSHPSVIIGRKGAYRGVHYSDEPFFAIDTAFYLKPKTDIDMRWAYYQLLTKDINGMDSGSAIPSTSREEFYLLPLSLPPLSEQRAIAGVLGALDDKIELNRRMNRTLEEMARALFRSWFVDFDPVRAKIDGRWHKGDSLPGLPAELYDLFPDRLVASELREIPRGWENKGLHTIADLNPESWSRANPPVGVKYVDLANTKWGLIENIQHYLWNDAPSRARRVLRKGDTIVGTVRPGNGSYALVGYEGLTGSTGFAVLRPTSHCFRELVYLAATSTNNIGRLSLRADGAAYPAIRPEIVAETTIAIPVGDTNLLNEFSGMAGPLFERMDVLKQEATVLAAQRDRLLPELMSGELRVQQPQRI